MAMSTPPEAPSTSSSLFESLVGPFLAWMATFRNELVALILQIESFRALTSENGEVDIDFGTERHFYISALAEDTLIKNPTTLPAAGKTMSGIITITQHATTAGNAVTWGDAWNVIVFDENTAAATKNTYAFFVDYDGETFVQHIRSS